MNLLIDTHILIWCLAEPSKLSNNILKATQDTKNTIYVSTISLWEISNLIIKGRIKLPDEDIVEVIKYSQFKLLNFKAEHAVKLQYLPLVEENKDTFDRMLVTQAIFENMIFVTNDEKIIKYADTYNVTLLK